MSEEKKLRRSASDRVIAGVCGGLGAHFGIDPVLVRVIFVLSGLFAMGGVLVYIVLWIVIPLEEPGV